QGRAIEAHLKKVSDQLAAAKSPHDEWIAFVQKNNLFSLAEWLDRDASAQQNLSIEQNFLEGDGKGWPTLARFLVVAPIDSEPDIKTIFNQKLDGLSVYSCKLEASTLFKTIKDGWWCDPEANSPIEGEGVSTYLRRVAVDANQLSVAARIMKLQGGRI